MAQQVRIPVFRAWNNGDLVLRILCVTPWFPASPKEQLGSFILHSVESLIELGHEVTVVATQPYRPKFFGHLHEDWQRSRIKVSSFGNQFPIHVINYPSIPRAYLKIVSDHVYNRIVSSKIERLLAETDFDVIHAHTEAAGYACLPAAKSHSVPLVVTLHGVNTHPRFNTKRQQKNTASLLNQADRVVLVGKPIWQHFAAIAGSDQNFCVVHNGFRFPEHFEIHKPDERQGPLRLISVSNLHEGKGIDLNLRALAKLSSEGLDSWAYVVVGEGRERVALEALAADLQLSDRVKFVGRRKWDQVFEHLNGADVFCLPSYREAFGIAYLEAMGCGLLAIGVRGQGPAEFITDGETGYLVLPRDVDSLAETLRCCIKGRDRNTRIAKAGQKLALERFSWARHAVRLDDLYRDVCRIQCF